VSDSADTDKRQHLRKPTEFGVQLDLAPYGEESALLEAITTNLSAGGLALRGTAEAIEIIDAAVAHRSPLGTRFSIPNRIQPIQALTKAQWMRRLKEPGTFGLGLRFEEITSISRDAIVEYVLNDLGLKEGHTDDPLMDKILAVDDLATRIEDKMKQIDQLLASVIAGRDILLEEVSSLRQIVLRLCEKP